MRSFLPLCMTGLLVAVSLLPTWNLQIDEKHHISVQQNGDGHVHIPDKINYIHQVRQTVESLNHSPHIMTIHHNLNDKSHAVKREVTVKFKVNPNDNELAKIYQDINGKMKRHWDHYWIFKSKTKETDRLIQYFTSRQDVEFAEPNFLLLPNKLPNDPLFMRYQWNLPMINADKAWNISQGNESIIVAVVDTGVYLGHEDFQGKLVKGYNVLTDTNDAMDDNGHGSHVAGIISASTNNTIGIAGLSWNNKIMPIKAIGADGTGSSFDIAKGIRWAADNGARVINMSVGNYHPSGILHESIRYASNKGVVLVAASGNDNTDQPSFPAAYPEVISVAAVDQNAMRADFSNYGHYIDVAAPGVDIPSTYIYDEYAALSGTSMACPHVAGLAGLILSVNPNLTNVEVRKIMEESAKDLGNPGKDIEYGYGMIDVHQALKIASNQSPEEPEPPTQTKSTDSWIDQLLFKLGIRPLQDLFGL